MLTVVPTPIGNLADITLRALEVLKSADWIACEDTRHTKRLLDHYEISGRLMALHDHNEENQIPEVISKLENGETLALVSDAGMPLVSDPGYRVVRAGQGCGIAGDRVAGGFGTCYRFSRFWVASLSSSLWWLFAG